MPPSDECDWHGAAIHAGPEESELLLRLAQSPIGDECQRCAICYYAQEYVERRLAERAGQVFAPDQSADATWRKLRAAVEDVRPRVHPSG